MQKAGGNRDFSQVFPEFQKFIISRGFVSKDKAPYFTWWVKQFAAFCANTTGDRSDRINDFLAYLRGKENIADWQIEQARQAVSMFLEHYLDAGPRIVRAYKHVETTIIYTHVLGDMANALQSLLNTLMEEEVCQK